MSKGKYSPSLTRDHCNRGFDEFIFNADREIPEEWNAEVAASGVKYDERIHYGDYDSEGYDRYGYSAFDRDGNYVGGQNGVDRWGYTEIEYLQMSDDDFNDICTYGGYRK